MVFLQQSGRQFRPGFVEWIVAETGNLLVLVGNRQNLTQEWVVGRSGLDPLQVWQRHKNRELSLCIGASQAGYRQSQRFAQRGQIPDGMFQMLLPGHRSGADKRLIRG